ncbi:glycosyltransferase family 39 protein [Streptacidiphilus sp. MAP5-3]|uniref:glycosyltransferase family 39 protein n=1 Tax=unclassified Streptacidiphilus TaxID=2643834 RepID=UPI0035139D46
MGGLSRSSSRPLRSAGLLAVVAVLTHLPSFLRPFWNPDEGYLATEARMLAVGGTLYTTVVDRKPPLLPWLYQAAFWVFGSDSLWPLRVLAVLAHLATALLLASVARRRWGPRAALVAGVLALLLSVGLSPEDSQAATFEVFMLPATAAAFWCADRQRWAGAGLATAAAAMVKQTGGAVLLPVLFLLLRQRDGRRAALVRVLLGSTVPVAALAVLLGPHDFLFWVVSGSSGYASLDGAWLTALARAAGNAALLGAAGLGVLLVVARDPRTSLREDGDLWVWLGGSALGVVTGLHFFGHYYLQLVPPLALLGASALHRAPARWTLAVLAWSAAAGVVFVVLGLTWSTVSVTRVQAVVRAVDARTGPGQPVLVWGMHPEIYWLADRPPASRYLTAGLLTNFAGGRDGRGVGLAQGVNGSWQTFEQEMREHPPGLFVDDSQGAPYGPDHIAPLQALLAAHGTRVGTVGGAVLYEWKP